MDGWMDGVPVVVEGPREAGVDETEDEWHA